MSDIKDTTDRDFFWFIRGVKNKTHEPEDDMPILRDLSATIEGNMRDLEQIQRQNAEKNSKSQKSSTDEHAHIPQFVKNHYLEKGEPIPKELLGTTQEKGSEKTQEVNGKTLVAQTEEEKKEKKPVILLQKKLIKDLAKNMKTQVFGQDDVIDEVVDVLKVAALNIKINKNKPAGCYFLAGPSGCGKTELALALANFLGDADCPIPFKVLNMGEFGMENDVTKLIGPPPGYKGVDEGGQLTNFVAENPISIVLLDEIEKAHSDMDKIFLSILDKGTCTDGKGNVVDFKNTIVIATSNLGAEVEYETEYTQEQKNEYRMARIKEGLRPEIINRYDSIFHCHAIDKVIYEKILNKFTDILKKNIKEEHQIELNFSPKLTAWAVENSYDPAMGGRPARKFIEKIIIKPLADQMIEDNINSEIHKEVTLDINKDGNVCFKGKKGKILGVLENTKDLVEKLKQNNFTKKPRP